MKCLWRSAAANFPFGKPIVLLYDITSRARPISQYRLYPVFRDQLCKKVGHTVFSNISRNSFLEMFTNIPYENFLKPPKKHFAQSSSRADLEIRARNPHAAV